VRIVASRGDVIVGFRPEHVRLHAEEAAATARIPARVDVVEYLGDDELVHVQAGSTELVALLPADERLRPGEEIELRVPLERLHLFDPESEHSLLPVT
jgi:ABC-type sugar transport system ATPase subunit